MRHLGGVSKGKGDLAVPGDPLEAGGGNFQSPSPLLRAILGGNEGTNSLWVRSLVPSAHPSIRSGHCSKKNVKFRFSFWGSRINYHYMCVTSQFPIAISIFFNRNFQTPVLV